MRYTCVLFDADDTLLDFQAGYKLAISETLARFGCRETAGAVDIYHRVNDRWWAAFERGEITMAQLSVGRFAEFLHETGLEGAGHAPEEWRDMYESRLASHCILIKGAQKLCESLRGRCRMFIITNGISRVQRERISRSPIKDCFEDIFISQEIGYQKPEREFFNYVVGHIDGAERRDMLVVGDSLSSDVRGGIDSGFDVCWYNPSGKSSGELRPKYIVGSLCEIEAIVAGESACGSVGA